MRVVKILHLLSHLRWLFLVWMIVLIIYVLISKPENPIHLVGQVIFISGIMMGLASLSDVTKMPKKQITDLSNPRNSKIQFIVMFAGVLILVMISVLFFSLRIIYPTANELYLNSFTKLGYDCLVMLLGFLCLIKQLTDQVNYAQSLNNN